MKYSLIGSVVLLFSLVACTSKRGKQNFLFDMGKRAASVENGFTKVTPDLLYTPAQGFGWLQAPDSTFDAMPARSLSSLDPDGVWCSDSLVFRADLPDGDYFLTITAGNKNAVPSSMLLFINGASLPDTITAPWYRLSSKTLRKKISVRDKKVLVKMIAVNKPVGLQAIELRPVTAWPAVVMSGGLDQDTLVVQNIVTSLNSQLTKAPASTTLLNQRKVFEQYLLACHYYNLGGWSWGVKSSGFTLIHRMQIAADLLQQVVADPGFPLYDKALYLLATIHYWLDAEDNDPYHAQQAQQYFTTLKKKYPTNDLLRMYLGEKIPHDTGVSFAAPGAPQWAVYQREAMSRMLQVIHWWVTERQAANGELGGKYGDDVEILRWWLPAILGADDSLARTGYLRLADGVWNSGILKRGFAKRIDDVEHSAELFSDTHPAMFLINYGDPAYVERCMISMQNFRDTWTGITSKGHRHFKSAWLSATEVLEQAPFAVDVPLNARACRPGLWTAWYNRNPTIIQLLDEWCRAWVADAARTDKGKPAGILPAAIGFAEDAIGGYSPNWYDPLLPYDYYKWESTGHTNELQYPLLGMYAITGYKKFLWPLNTSARYMQEARATDSLQQNVPGSAAWIKALLTGGDINSTAKLFSLAKRLTGSHQYDSLIAQYGQPYNKYELSHNKNEITHGFEDLLNVLRYNFPLFTSEVKFTDRVYVPGNALLSGMYTGHFAIGYEYPSLVATWKNTGKEVAVFVRRGNNRSAGVTLYNFGAARSVIMNSWQLEPGLYKVQTGIDNNEDEVIDEMLTEEKITLTERVNPISIQVPSGKTLVVAIEQVQSNNKPLASAPDLAITANDISVEQTGSAITVQCILHNIGNARAKNILVELLADHKKVVQQTLTSLDAPNDLVPRQKTVVFNVPGIYSYSVIGIKVSCDQQEITKGNNFAERKVLGQ